MCPHVACGRPFGYKHLLQRHLARVHVERPTSNDDDDDADADESTVEAEADVGEPTKTRGTEMTIDMITGAAYTRCRSIHKLQCPYPDLSGLFTATEDSLDVPAGAEGCDYAFNRAYDLRRHLKAEHNIVLEKEAVDSWAKRKRP